MPLRAPFPGCCHDRSFPGILRALCRGALLIAEEKGAHIMAMTRSSGKDEPGGRKPRKKRPKPGPLEKISLMAGTDLNVVFRLRDDVAWVDVDEDGTLQLWLDGKAS